MREYPCLEIMAHRPDAPMPVEVLDAFIERFCTKMGVERGDVMIDHESSLFLRLTPAAEAKRVETAAFDLARRKEQELADQMRSPDA